MTEFHNLLVKIGVNTQSFDSGLITGMIIVLIVVVILLIVFSIFKRKKTVVLEANDSDSVNSKIKELEISIKQLKSEEKVKLEEKFNEGALYSLVLLQREGRFVDFIKEDIEAFEDEQIGAAVRQIHSGCRKVLNENFDIKPLFQQAEGEAVALEENFDPFEVKLSGNVPEKAPFKGHLRHKGWKSDQVRLPKRTGNVNAKVVCPAEIEF